ncbi:MAG: DNA repair protein RadC [Bacteroidetes bacterium]|nr:DNA repair protein RadC [Bacteroidota bacterium]
MGEYKQNLTIKTWAEDDRPREKLVKLGRHALSDAELIAILIRAGTRKSSAVELSKQLLSMSGNNLNTLAKLTYNDIKKVKGIGLAKALSIIAALELGRRRKESELQRFEKITSSRDIYETARPLFLDLPLEEFWIFILNKGNRIIDKFNISKGGVSGTVVDARVIFKRAVELLASGIVLCHNHPSGNLYPSQNDIDLTRRLEDAGKLLEINVVDHLIICETGYYSFADERKL